MAYIKKTVLAKFPSKDKSGRKKSKIGKAKTHHDKRQEALNTMKSYPPAYNGWWYYQYFMDALKSKKEKQMKRGR